MISLNEGRDHLAVLLSIFGDTKPNLFLIAHNSFILVRGSYEPFNGRGLRRLEIESRECLARAQYDRRNQHRYSISKSRCREVILTISTSVCALDVPENELIRSSFYKAVLRCLRSTRSAVRPWRWVRRML